MSVTVWSRSDLHLIYDMKCNKILKFTGVICIKSCIYWVAQGTEDYIRRSANFECKNKGTNDRDTPYTQDFVAYPRYKKDNNYYYLAED